MKLQREKRKTVGSYPSANVIFSITTALFMIGLFALSVLNASRLTQKLKEDIEIQILLSNSITGQERAALEQTLLQKEYLDRQGGEVRIRFRSKEDWAKEMAEATGEDFVAFLGENPLRDALLIHVRSAFHAQTKMQQIQTELQALPGVFEVVYAERFIAKINANLARMGLFLSVFVLIFLVTVVVLIHNAIKLALFSQRFLIRSMQLVGATAGFIKRPFLIRAWWQGVLSGAIASAFLLFLLGYALQQVEELAVLQNYWLNTLICALLMLLGGLVSAGSAYLAVNKYLYMKLNELY